MFGPKQVTGDWRKLYIEELHDLYILPYNIRVIKSRWMRWSGHVASMGERKNAYEVSIENSEGKTHQGGLGIDGSLLLKSFLKK
jgi:hypothetical protein